MAKVFVSHASEDRMVVECWHGELKDAGHEVFLACHLRDGITVGENWMQRLISELRQADVVVCAVSWAFTKSKVCEQEVKIALSRDVPLLPVFEPGVVYPPLTVGEGAVQHTLLKGALPALIGALRRIDDASRHGHPPVGPPSVSAGATGGATSVKRFVSWSEPELFGRVNELAKLQDFLNPAAQRGPNTIAVTGLAGMGKTTVASYAGSAARNLFRGGVVHVNMNGYDLDRQARTSAKQVYGPLLRELGVEGRHDMVDSGALYRRTLAEWNEQGRSVLLMLDNVFSRDQVEGLLLPACPAHRFMITSRDADFLAELPGLGKLDPLRLAPLDVQDAVNVLEAVVHRQHLGDQRLSREPDKAIRLAELCSCFPQALELVGGTLAGSQHMRLDDLIRRLEEVPFDVLKPVKKAFQMSWQGLDEAHGAQAARLLLLSVNPGPDMPTEAVAALAGMREKQEVRELREVLQCAHLITYHATDRWEMHDLVRQYVHKLATEHATAADRDAAFVRLLNHYQQHAADAAKQAGWFLLRHSRPTPERDPTPTWKGRTAALSYFETERVNLLGCLRDATELVGAKASDPHLGVLLVDLTAAMAGFLRNSGPWEVAVQAHETAARIAEHLELPLERAIALNDLGIMHRLQRNWSVAQDALERADEVFRGLSDTRTRLLGRANTLNERGIVANDRGRSTHDRADHGHARQVLEEAWGLYSDVNDRIGMANSAKNLGVAQRCLGLLGEAGRWLDIALKEYIEINDVLGVVEVHNHLGLLSQKEGDYERAQGEFSKAINLITREGMNSLPELARAYEGTGICRKAINELADAVRFLGQAQGIYVVMENFSGVTRMCNELGLLHLTLKDWDKACAAFREAIGLMGKKKIENPRERARAHEGIARCQIADAIRSLNIAERGYSEDRADQERDQVVTMRNELQRHACG